MAVYTHVSEDELRAFLSAYDLGALKRFEGIAQGVENTNYFVDAGDGRFVLTLFEKRVREDDLPYFMRLMTHLAGKRVAVPRPIPGSDGEVLRRLCGRPAAMVSRLNGEAVMQPAPDQCRAAGETLAALHRAGADFGEDRANPLGLEGWRSLAARCAGKSEQCASGLAGLIGSELEFLDARWPGALPKGLIHADLFPDNVFFDGGRVSGVIDFYFACADYYAYDLAICLNSWANHDAGWRSDNAAALLAGYESVRPLSAAETEALPVLLRGAALRFLLTRLHDWLNQVEGALVKVKDPLEYRDLLAFHRRTSFDSIIGQNS